MLCSHRPRFVAVWVLFCNEIIETNWKNMKGTVKLGLHDTGMSFHSGMKILISIANEVISYEKKYLTFIIMTIDNILLNQFSKKYITSIRCTFKWISGQDDIKPVWLDFFLCFSFMTMTIKQTTYKSN